MPRPKIWRYSQVLFFLILLTHCFVESGLKQFVERNLKDHWRIYIFKCRIRVFPIKDAPALFNAIAHKVIPGGNNAINIKTQTLKEVTRKNGQGIVDCQRIAHNTTVNWLDELKEEQNHKVVDNKKLNETDSLLPKVNWVAALSFPTLIAWTRISPKESAFDTRRITEHEAAVRPHILRWELLNRISEPKIRTGNKLKTKKGKTIRLDLEAVPVFENQLRLRYGIYRNKDNLLIPSPPSRLLSSYDGGGNSGPDFHFAELSPYNYSLPTWEYLVKRALELKLPAEDDNKRRHLKLIVNPQEETKKDRLVLPDIGTFEQFTNARIPVHYGELGLPLILPLQLRLLLAERSQFNAYWQYPLPEYVLDGTEQEMMAPSSKQVEYLKTYPTRLRMYASQLQESLDTADSTLGLESDPMWASLKVYRDYQVGCCLYTKEEDVIAHILRVNPGGADNVVGLYELLRWGNVLWYHWSMLLVRKNLQHLCPTARKSLKDILVVHNRNDITRDRIIAPEIASAAAPKSVMQQKETWLEFFQSIELHVKNVIFSIV
jgi:hypothetical protein